MKNDLKEAFSTACQLILVISGFGIGCCIVGALAWFTSVGIAKVINHEPPKVISAQTEGGLITNHVVLYRDYEQALSEILATNSYGPKP